MDSLRVSPPPPRTAAPQESRWLLLPREHGAWGMLLVPFVCAAILGGRWDWLYIPTLLLALTGFVMREPLTILARQKWVWRERKAESAVALRCLAWQVPLSVALCVVCMIYLPPGPVVVLVGVGMVVTAAALWMTVKNRQRSIALQAVSSVGLATTALLASLVAERSLPPWSWVLWALLSLHGAGSILTVRARLEMRSGGRAAGVRTWAWAFHIVQVLGAAALVFSASPWLAAPSAFPRSLISLN